MKFSKLKFCQVGRKSASDSTCLFYTLISMEIALRRQAAILVVAYATLLPVLIISLMQTAKPHIETPVGRPFHIESTPEEATEPASPKAVKDEPIHLDFSLPE